MKYIINVENIKCGGCVKTIVTKLESIDGVTEVEVDLDEGQVSFNAGTEDQSESVKEQLLRMGYPEVGSVEGLSSVGAKAKSFVSCAMGKI